MRRNRLVPAAVLVLWLAATGCATLRELPRSAYDDVPERRGVRIETRDGLVYDFDYATFADDSLIGYRHRSDVEGAVGELAMLRIALDDVQRLQTRKLDWYRTGLASGTVLAGVLVAGLGGSKSGSSSGSNPTSPGGGGGRGF